jgi:hypothetical protein
MITIGNKKAGYVIKKTEWWQMTQNTIFLSCALKKSASVFKKLLIPLCIATVVITPAVLLYYCGSWAYPIFTQFVHLQLLPIGNEIITILQLVPWWAYVIIGIVGFVFAYSIVWCILREMVIEDWENELAYQSEMLLFVVGMICVELVGCCIGKISNKSIFGIIILGVCFSFGFIMITAFDVFNIQHILCFPGAYIHYRKRIKNQGGLK